MNCPNCGRRIVNRKRRCEFCGQDIQAFNKLRQLSNRLYNEGLLMAQGRNLSGAIVLLKKSLEMNKENIAARNLLGLVYYEMGNTVEAISEWVISTNLSKEDNMADGLLNVLQSDKTQFDALSSAAKKYNIALEQIRQGQEDLAVIQLKKVLGLNPKHVKAMLVLSLVYIKNCEYERAKKVLKGVLKIDAGNPHARRYIDEIKEIQEQGKPSVASGFMVDETDDVLNLKVAPGSRDYSEERPNFVAFLTFFGGILLGILVIYFLALPSMKTKMLSEFSEKERTLGQQVSHLKSEINSLENTNRAITAEKEELSSKYTVSKANEETYKALLEQYESLLGVDLDELNSEENNDDEANNEAGTTDNENAGQ